MTAQGPSHPARTGTQPEGPVLVLASQIEVTAIKLCLLSCPKYVPHAAGVSVVLTLTDTGAQCLPRVYTCPPCLSLQAQGPKCTEAGPQHASR